jgi:hypothetical protein
MSSFIRKLASLHRRYLTRAKHEWARLVFYARRRMILRFGAIHSRPLSFVLFRLDVLMLLFIDWKPGLRELCQKNEYFITQRVFAETFAGKGVNYKFLTEEYFHNPFTGLLEGLENTLVGRWVASNHDSFKALTERASTPRKRNEPKEKILFLTRSWGFIQPLIDRITKDPEGCLEAKTLDLAPFYNHLASLNKPISSSGMPLAELLFSEGPSRPSNNQAWQEAQAYDHSLSEKVDWADVIFVDWGNQSALWATRVLPVGKKIIIRIHSYEAFTRFPIHFDKSKILALVFVSPAIQMVFEDLFNEFGFAAIPKVVIPNFAIRSTDALVSRKPEFSYRLCMLQYALPVKGSLFALDVIETLLEKDARWTLTLAGPDFERSGIAPNDAQRLAFEKRVRKLKGAVRVEGYIEDTQSWYLDHDIILSCSEREGTHESLIEASCTGCIPVLRNWPLISYYNPVETAFEGYQGHDVPQAMADEITSISQNYKEHREKAVEFAETKSLDETYEMFQTLIARF